MDIKAGAEDVMKNFVKKNHSEGVGNPKSYIKKGAYLVLVNRLKDKIKERKEARELVELRESGKGEMFLLSDFTKNGTLSPEDMAIIKDCIDRLNTKEKTFYYDYLETGSLRGASERYDFSYGKFKYLVDPVIKKVQDCVHGISAD